jgi:hypothetical protein
MTFVNNKRKEISYNISEYILISQPIKILKMKIVWKRKEKVKPPVPLFDDEFYKDGPTDVAVTILFLLFLLIIVLLIFYANHILSL